MSPVEQFLNGLLSPVGAGALLWMLMGTIFKAAPNLNGELKFLRIYLGYDVFTTEGMLLAIGIGYLVSQGVHRGSQEIRAAVADTKAPGEV
jgi:hypothetical protein